MGEGIARTLARRRIPFRSCDVKQGEFTTDVGSITDAALVRRLMDGVTGVLHTATLHKPHVVTHSRQDFIDVNVSGTQTLLTAASAAKVRGFVFTSTTSVFGEAMQSAQDAPPVWVSEALTPVAKNIYGATKLAAESLCKLAHKLDGLPVVILRTSRFFPEEDDSKAAREQFDQTNLKLVELLYRRVDLEDCVEAHFVALDRAEDLPGECFIISATTPFLQRDLPRLRHSLGAVVEERVPFKALFEDRGWEMPQGIDRVYDNARARARLGWQPKHNFEDVLSRIANGGDPASALARAVGAKGYHDVDFCDGPFPVA